ncbi:MAG: hypothetical protein ACTHK4_12380 [Mycobacteriales bacterium]
MASRGRRAGDGALGRSADDQAIIDLLDAVREVRTALAIDLSVAAGALEEDHPEVASDILAATSAGLERAHHNVPHPDGDELAVRRHARRRRTLIALPAVPLVGAIAMTAAAALSGASHQHATSGTAQHAIVHHASATSTLHRLETVVNQHPRAAQVIAVADDLHQQLTQMIASSTNDAQLHMVQHLLTLEQRVLERSKVPGTQLALAASRELAELLKHQPVQVRTKREISNHSAPTSAPKTHTQPSATPTPTHRQSVSQPTPSSSTSQESPSPTPSNGLFGQAVLNQPR